MILIDTHALIWWVAESAELSPRARRAIETAKRRGPILVSAVSVFEVSTLVRRGRLQLGVALDVWLGAVRSLADVRVEPVTDVIAQLAGSFTDPVHGDPADRIIAATAMTLQTRLVSADEKMRSVPGLEIVW